MFLYRLAPKQGRGTSIAVLTSTRRDSRTARSAPRSGSWRCLLGSQLASTSASLPSACFGSRSDGRVSTKPRVELSKTGHWLSDRVATASHNRCSVFERANPCNSTESLTIPALWGTPLVLCRHRTGGRGGRLFLSVPDRGAPVFMGQAGSLHHLHQLPGLHVAAAVDPVQQSQLLLRTIRQRRLFRQFREATAWVRHGLQRPWTRRVAVCRGQGAE